jgi:glycosyltransferase involved in cell wall biosynthesis
MDDRKGLEHLLNAWGDLQGDFPTWTLQLVGPSGNYELPSKSKLDEINVKLIGEVDKVESLSIIAKSKILVLPSLREQSPMVIWESMSVGTPIAASRLSGIEFQLSQDYPFLSEPGNARDLENNLRKLMSDEDLLIQTSRFLVERSAQSKYESLEPLYKQIYAGKA